LFGNSNICLFGKTAILFTGWENRGVWYQPFHLVLMLNHVFMGMASSVFVPALGIEVDSFNAGFSNY
jgi:hypothetical protein